MIRRQTPRRQICSPTAHSFDIDLQFRQAKTYNETDQKEENETSHSSTHMFYICWLFLRFNELRHSKTTTQIKVCQILTKNRAFRRGSYKHFYPLNPVHLNIRQRAIQTDIISKLCHFENGLFDGKYFIQKITIFSLKTTEWNTFHHWSAKGYDVG